MNEEDVRGVIRDAFGCELEEAEWEGWIRWDPLDVDQRRAGDVGYAITPAGEDVLAARGVHVA